MKIGITLLILVIISFPQNINATEDAHEKQFKKAQELVAKGTIHYDVGSIQKSRRYYLLAQKLICQIEKSSPDWNKTDVAKLSAFCEEKMKNIHEMIQNNNAHKEVSKDSEKVLNNAVEQWRIALSIFENGERFYLSEEYEESYKEFIRSFQKLNAIMQKYPDWNTNIVKSRIDISKLRMTSVRLRCEEKHKLQLDNSDLNNEWESGLAFFDQAEQYHIENKLEDAYKKYIRSFQVFTKINQENPRWNKELVELRVELSKMRIINMKKKLDELRYFPHHSALKNKHLTKEDLTTSPNISSQPQGKRWAVIIGISQYKDSRVPSLRYAEADCLSFHKWLTSPSGGKYAPVNVKLLLGKEATGRNIRSALFQWLKQAIEEDMVTIFFAGHGSPESPDAPENLYLLPYDVEYENIPSTAFPMWDIETALKRHIIAKRVVVIADACHSGGVGESFDVARRTVRGMKVAPVNTELEKLSSVQEGVCVITASGSNQFSQEGKQWGGGHGVFTHYLVKGLSGEADYNRNGKSTIGELILYLSQEVRRATKNAQCPTAAGKFDPALSIGK